MPPYEVALLLRGTLNQPQLSNVLKRSCQEILKNGSIIRKIENLGYRNLPYIMSSHGTNHRTGNYFLVHFDAPVSALEGIKKEFSRDSDIIKNGMQRRDEEFKRPCLEGPCQFGELPDPLHEKNVYRLKTRKTLARTYGKPSLIFKRK